MAEDSGNMTQGDPSVTRRLFVEGSWRSRRWLAGTGLLVLLAAGGLGLAMPLRYVSHTTLVLMLGPEYTVRMPAGSGPPPSTSFDADHILGTETEILSSDDLHRDVVHAIGVRRLYPRLLERPTLVARALAAIKGLPDMLARLAGFEAARHRADDPAELAVAIFADKLDIKPSKLASVITLGFSNPDPVVARDALLALERLYLQRRRALYARHDSTAMRADVGRARAALDGADAALLAFRAGHVIPDYAAQLATLLREQGDIDQDGIAARRAGADGQARIEALRRQRAGRPALVSGGSDSSLDAHTAALRDDLDTLRSRAAATLSRYRADSPAALDIATQIGARAGELSGARSGSLSATHTVRNATLDTIDASLVQLGADARGIAARLAADGAENAMTSQRIAALGANQRALDVLQTRRDGLLDDLRGLEAAASSQEGVEAVEAVSLPSVRVAAVPSLPLRPRPLRALLIVAGMIGSVFAMIAGALVGHAFRRTILLGEEIEALGMTLLARIPRDDLLASLPPIRPLAA